MKFWKPWIYTENIKSGHDGHIVGWGYCRSVCVCVCVGGGGGWWGLGGAQTFCTLWTKMKHLQKEPTAENSKLFSQNASS